MKKLAITKIMAVTLFLFWVCTLFSSPADAAWAGNIVDTFDGASINTRLWRPFQYSPHQRVTQQGGELIIQNDAGSNDGAGLISKFFWKGDFEMRVDYRLITWPPVNGVRLGFEDLTFMLKRVSYGPGELIDPKENYLSTFKEGSTYSWYNVPTTDDHGTLKLTRTGSVLTGYSSKDGGPWQIIGSHDFSNAPELDEWVGVTLCASGAPTTSYVEIAFDNFQVSYDQVRFNSDLSPMTLPLLD
jgi:hypothetical protein